MAVTDRKTELKAALVAAAERTIAAEGLSALRARDLAREVGCALGAIYTAFPDLDALILEVNLGTLALFERAIAAPRERAGVDGSGPATIELVRLGTAYLAFATEHPRRWRALFQHRMAGDRAPPAWFVEQQARLFAFIEAPLAALCPALPAAERSLLARTLFSATHGVVSLGLDEKLAALPRDTVRQQLETMIAATAAGLAGPAAR